MKKKKILFATVLASCLMVPTIVMAVGCNRGDKGHQHTYSNEWSTSATEHWHSSTCGHDSEIIDKEAHHWGVWEQLKGAALHKDAEIHRKCLVCNFEETDIIEGTATHNYDENNWEKDASGHWHKSTCDDTAPTHEAMKKDFATHSGDWTVKTPATYVANEVQKRNCEVCGFYEEKEMEGTKLPAKPRTITVGDLTGLVYNKTAQPINDKVTTTNNEGGLKIEYRVKGTETYATTAPINAGNYEYRITLTGTPEWAEAVANGEFTIQKFTVTLSTTSFEMEYVEPTLEHTKLMDGTGVGGETVEICADISYSSPGRHLIPMSELFVSADKNNYQVSAGTTQEVAYTVWDTADYFSGIQNILTVSGKTVITTKIIRGTVKVGDELSIVELGKNITIKKIELNRTSVEKATAGDEIGLMIEGVAKAELQRGFTVAKQNTISTYETVKATIRLKTKDEGGRNTPILNGYHPTIRFSDVGKDVTGYITLPEEVEMLMPGETLANVRIDFASFEPNFVGRNFVLLEGGKTIAEGQITELCERTAELSVESVTKEEGSSVIYLVNVKVKGLIKKEEFVTFEGSEKFYRIGNISVGSVAYTGQTAELRLYSNEANFETLLTGKTLTYQKVENIALNENVLFSLNKGETAYYAITVNNDSGVEKLLKAKISGGGKYEIKFRLINGWSQMPYADSTNLSIRVSAGQTPLAIELTKIDDEEPSSGSIPGVTLPGTGMITLPPQFRLSLEDIA